MRKLRCVEIPRDIHAEFLSRVSHSPFHELQWLDAIVEHYSCKPRLLGCYEDGKLFAVIPLLGRRMGPFLVWGSPLRKTALPPSTPFCAPSEVWKDALTCLDRWAADNGVKYLQVSLPGNSIPKACRWRSEKIDNLELPLQPPLEQLWLQLFKKTRWCVRTAVRKGVRVHYCSNPDFLAFHRKMIADTYDPQGRPPHISNRFYSELCLNARDYHLRVIYATHEGVPVASIWVVHDEQTCYYWDAAATNVGRKLNANHLLVWTLIRWCKHKGLTKLDFVGSAVGGEGNTRPGIGRFKRSMGAAPVPRLILYRYTPLLRLALGGYRTWNRCRVAVNALMRAKSS